MTKLFVNNIGDLSEIQRGSFYHFLYNGILEEFAHFPNPFLSRLFLPTRRGEKIFPGFVFLAINDLKWKGPEVTIETAFKKSKTYAINLYIPAEYYYPFDQQKDKNLNNQINFEIQNKNVTTVRVKQDIFFGEIPLMTEEGTFIIGGYERVVISQIIRSPGIYFRKENTNSRGIFYTATLISNKGIWTKFLLEENPQKPNIDQLYIKLSQYQKISRKSKETSENEKFYLFDLLRFFGLSLEEIYDSLKYPFHLRTQQLSREKVIKDEDFFDTVKKLFFNQRNGSFSIGRIGRQRLNRQLNLNVNKDCHYLTAYDFLSIIDGLIELKYYGKRSDDIDHMKNKLIRSIGELLQMQIRTSIYKLEKFLNDARILNVKQNNEKDTKDSILDVRGITGGIKDFFLSSQLSQFMDQINPLAEMSHKRKITLFGPNGLKRDHISTNIRDIHPSQYGRFCPIETPEGQNAGLISTLALFGKIDDLGWITAPYFSLEKGELEKKTKTIFLDPEEESKVSIGFLEKDINYYLKKIQEPISLKKNYTFLRKPFKDLNFLAISPLQIISLSTALIPFLEHNDANRSLMGSNMQRQAVPLLYPQKPIIGTGLESIAILNSGMIVKSYSEGKVIHTNSTLIKIEDFNGQVLFYYLRKHNRSNQETYSNQRPIVWPGERVYFNQIIADGPGTKDGELAIGKNLTMAYMPWEGYNYEDAIIINERLIYDDCLTSVHIEEIETQLNYYLTGNEKLTNNLSHCTNFSKRHLSPSGIVRIGSYVKQHDILVGKLTPCEEDNSPEARLLKAIYGQKKPSFRDTSLRVSHGIEGRVIDIRILSTNAFPKEDQGFMNFSEQIQIYIAQIRKIQIGDKLAGRHGNKGIISRILPKIDMPYLPDGTIIDILFNPLGVPSRMNLGQIFECLLGLAGEKLGKRFKIIPFDEIYGKEASRILINQKLKEAAIQSESDWLFEKYSPGKIFLRDGRTGEYFDNPVTIGKSYILKLIHLVEDKIHARATGPYSMITEQPLAGKAQNGGQRFGEMEVWALEAYGCSYTLQELLTIKSDDIDGRNDMYEAIIVRKSPKKPNPSIPESFLALMRELHSLGLDFSLKKVQKGKRKIKEYEKDIFLDLEDRLLLRAFLARLKASQRQDSGRSDNDKFLKESKEKDFLKLFKDFLKKREKLEEKL